MAVTTLTPVDHALTAKVIQGLADRSDFCGLRIAPALGQDSLSTNYPVISLGDGEMMRSNMKRREPGTEFKKVDAKIGLDTSTVEGDGVDVVVPLEVYEDALNSSLDALAVYGEEAYLNGLRLHESRIVSLAQGSDFTAANSQVAYTVANKATIDLAADIQSAIRRVKQQGEKANLIAMSGEVWDRVRFSGLLRDFIAGSVNPGALVSPENLQRAFAVNGIQSVEVCDSYVNDAAKNKVNISQIWANTHIFVGAADATANGGDSIGTSRNMRSAIKTFFWSKLFNAPFVVKSFYDEKVESYIVRAWGYTNEKVVNSRAGTRITTQYA